MQAGIATIWHNPCFNTVNRASRMRFGSKIFQRARGVFQLNEEGIHHACFHV